MNPKVQSYVDKMTSDFEKYFEPTLSSVTEGTINSLVSAKGCMQDAFPLMFPKGAPKGESEYAHRQGFVYVLAEAESRLNLKYAVMNLIIAGYAGGGFVSALPRFSYASVRPLANVSDTHVFGKYDGIFILRSRWVPSNQILCMSVPAFGEIEGHCLAPSANKILKNVAVSNKIVKISLQTPHDWQVHSYSDGRGHIVEKNGDSWEIRHEKDGWLWYFNVDSEPCYFSKESQAMAVCDADIPIEQNQALNIEKNAIKKTAGIINEMAESFKSINRPKVLSPDDLSAKEKAKIEKGRQFCEKVSETAAAQTPIVNLKIPDPTTLSEQLYNAERTCDEIAKTLPIAGDRSISETFEEFIFRRNIPLFNTWRETLGRFFQKDRDQSTVWVVGEEGCGKTYAVVVAIAYEISKILHEIKGFRQKYGMPDNATLSIQYGLRWPGQYVDESFLAFCDALLEILKIDRYAPSFTMHYHGDECVISDIDNHEILIIEKVPETPILPYFGGGDKLVLARIYDNLTNNISEGMLNNGLSSALAYDSQEKFRGTPPIHSWFIVNVPKMSNALRDALESRILEGQDTILEVEYKDVAEDIKKFSETKMLKSTL